MTGMPRLKSRLKRLVDYVMGNDVWLSIAMAMAIIALGLFLGWYNNRVVSMNQAPHAHYMLEPGNPLSFMSNWDGPNYLDIAAHGYHQLSSTNFFPLYPLVIRIVNLVIPSLLDSALLVTWVSFAGALYFYLKIVKHLFRIKDNAEAIRGVIFFALFPTAIFMLATYTEALFACLALGTIYFALRKKWLIAAFFAMFSTATHITGVLLIVLLALILLEEGIGKTKVLLAAAIASLGIISYAVLLWKYFYQPIAFITSQKSHGWLQHGFSNFFNSLNIISAVFIVLLLVTAVYWWPKRKSFSIYALLFILIPLAGREFGGFNRYVLVAFPLQLMLYGYLRGKKTIYPLALALSAIGWSYFMLQYAGGYVGG